MIVATVTEIVTPEEGKLDVFNYSVLVVKKTITETMIEEAITERLLTTTVMKAMEETATVTSPTTKLLYVALRRISRRQM